ncbi:MAG TPA: ABC transporter ATP-binding protein [Acidimicrobiales bacterium]|nr:ABC transporter ATP-binding protein [Acidimicrobiales bacterium]
MTGRQAPLLSVRDLKVVFPTPIGMVHAVDGVSFDLEAGQSMGIVGESGSGKTVTAKTLMNLLPSYALVDGSVNFDGRDLRALAAERKTEKHLWGVEISMVFQDPMTSLNPVKKVGEQIAESVRYHLGQTRTAARRQAGDLLEQVGIPEPGRRLDEYPHQLSGGLRQRVVIAAALACEPRILIADEPTTSLDVTVQKHILDLLDDLRTARGMAMILVTHDLGVVKGRTDEVMVMYAGRTMEEASTGAVFSQQGHPYTEALIETIPKINSASHTRLVPIPGQPPVTTSPPAGYPFADRCRYATDLCVAQGPPLTALGNGHHVACHTPVRTPAAETALAVNAARGHTATGLEIHQSGVPTGAVTDGLGEQI